MSYKGKIGVTVLALIALVIVLGVGFSTLKAPVTAIQQAREAWVDDDDPTCGGNSPCFRTIQAAVDAVDDSGPDGGFVYIRPGHYRENVAVKRTVSLIGVESVRIEAADPKRPTILISNGLQSRPVKIINHLEIFGGKVGIDVVDARIEVIAGNRITSLNDTQWGTYGSLSLPWMEAGIWVERAVIGVLGIRDNEISNAGSGIVLRQGAFVSNISMNTIQRTGWGILLQDDAKADSISTNTFKHNSIHIRVTGQAWADIVNNQMLLAESSGITVMANSEGGWLSRRLTIENNLIADNHIGIYLTCQNPSSGTPFGVSEEDPCPGQQGPNFSIIRNRIVGGLYGIIVVTGQGKILRNRISENGFTTEVFEGAGLLLGVKMQVEISHNWIVNNTWGVVYSLADQYYNCQFERRPLFEGKLAGSNNEIRDNEFADLCPPDYPWPPGFRK